VRHNGRVTAPGSIGDQRGKTIVVTGANSGLGLVTARLFAEAGADVVLAVRDIERGRRAAACIAGSTTVSELDLADLSSVRRFASDWNRPVDLLVNNAGVMAVPFQLTADGFEMQIGTNHLGPFALTNLLLPHVTDRVVTVSSVAHRIGRINLDDLNWRRRRYRRWSAYGQSKLANLLFTLELQRRLVLHDSSVRAVAAHPGYAATKLQSHTGSAVESVLLSVGNRLFAQNDVMGAQPILFAGTRNLPGAAYVGPDGRGEARGHPRLVGRSAAAADAEMAERLWTLSESLTGVGFGLGDQTGTA
jgi:NAD(P)-dependent dehydrogenase (short-subunit alcohol dehydrogenase family)